MHQHRDEEVIHVHNHSRRVDGGLIIGALAGFAGWLGTTVFNSAKLIPFDREVAQRTRADILGRGGLGAGIAESGAFNGSATGMGNHIIEEAHRLAVIEEPGFGYAKRIMQLGGRSTVALFAGAIAGIAGLGAYFAFKKSEPAQEAVTVVQRPQRFETAAPTNTAETTTKNWQEAVQKETAAEHSRSA